MTTEPKRRTPESITRSLRFPAWLWDQAREHATDQARTTNSYVIYAVKSQLVRDAATGIIAPRNDAPENQPATSHIIHHSR